MSEYCWQGRTPEEWRRLLNLPAFYAYQEVTSTNDVALRLADAGAQTLTVIVADHQTRGRGRGGNAWLSASGTSLLCSIVFRAASATPATPGVAPIRVGLGVARAIEDAGHRRVMVKWPNDIVIPGFGKVAGILCEAAFRQQGAAHIVAGVGVNITHPGAHYVSLVEAGVSVQRDELLERIVERLRPCAGAITEPLTDEELAALRERDILFDQQVTNEEGLRGRACGMLRDGALQIETADGIRAVYSAGIRLAETRAYPGARA